MQTDQRLSINQLEIDRSEKKQNKSESQQQKDKNCFLRIIQSFLQAILHFIKLYRYNDRWDFLLLIIGIIFSIGTGFGLPLFAVVAGKTIDSFDKSPEVLAHQADNNKNYLLAIGFSMFAAGTISFSSWLFLGERISMKFRYKYLKSLMKQQIQYFKSIDEEQLAEKFQQHMINIKEAAGLKAGTLIYIAASFIIAGKIATENGFFLSLVMIPTLPILGISGFAYSIFVQLRHTKLMKLYSKAQQKVRQSLGFIRTIKQLNGQSHQTKIFSEFLKIVQQKVIKYCILAGLGAGIFSLVQFLVYCLAFWLGSHCVQGSDTCAKLVKDQNYSPGSVILIFFAFFVRLDSMQQLFPALKRIYNGTSSYQKIYKVISRKSFVCCPFQKQRDVEIDFRKMKLTQILHHMKQKAIKLKEKIYNQNNQPNQQNLGLSLEQNLNVPQRLKIQFCNVTVFSKIDPTNKILDDLCLSIQKQFVALNGKSEEKEAILDLILRLYDPDKGKILINGIDIKKINLCQLRNKIGYLDRKTYLFQTTIRQNIALGNQCITDQMIWTVLEDLHIAETIKLFDDQLNSFVGFEGAKLSQTIKKKIAVARILIKNPQIMLFQEYYSFDSDDQQFRFILNLDQIKKKKIVIYAGNNLKIKKRADQIIVLQMGKLLSRGGFNQFYQQQINLQEDFEGTNRINDLLYRSSVKSAFSLKSSDAVMINQSASVTQGMQTSPQKKILLQEQSRLIKYKSTIHKKLLSYIHGNFIAYGFGAFSCIISGALYPMFTIFMSDILMDTFQLQKNRNQSSYIRQKIDNPILFILWIGIISFFASFFQVFIFSVISEKIGQKLRIQSFSKVLKLPIEWFSQDQLRSAFKMSQTIKIDPTRVQNLVTNFYSIIIKNTSSFIAGMIIAFIYEWRSALLGFIVLPMMMLSGYLSVIFYSDQANLSKKYYIDSASIVAQVVLNMKAVHTQNCQELILQNYKAKLEIPLNKSKQRVVLCSMIFGLSQLLILISYTIMFYFSTIFYRDNQQITTLNLLTAIFAVIWSGWTSGANFIRLPGNGKSSCQKAAANLFFLLDEIDQEQSQIQSKSKLLKTGIKGNIQFKDVKINFKQMGFYIDKVSFKIEQKNRIAIFATSSIDIKSIIDLLYRFSEPQEGKILIDNQSIKDYQINYLRSSLGVIRQEPLIFNGTIIQNVVYNTQDLTEEKISEICKITNVISILNCDQNTKKLGGINQTGSQQMIAQNRVDSTFEFDTKQLSVSQKQRISMARTMLKQPKILLINDEIHDIGYFYDQEIREAIRNVIKDRTSIFMPHYQQNLEVANAIIVLEKDKILQLGKYEDLKSNSSLYKRIKKNYDLMKRRL